MVSSVFGDSRKDRVFPGGYIDAVDVLMVCGEDDYEPPAVCYFSDFERTHGFL